MNLVMISQTAQCRIFEFEVRERCLASENERLTVFVCYHRAVQYGFNYTRCIEKSHLGAVTFGKACCFVHSCSKKIERAQIGEGVRWFLLHS